ncbi:uncharacterized protein TRAVEDRAFT_66952 [Trametes versicolor FP-101664 SS1]|uniref:uncharacterized protein n=1 Tax=Trametes versicolor (strain FP-101664) TaxID=717944 RepID=UPI00046242A2|nr:uncharacterized protein TRAVEDRAFT_66952 [Trametes versicolor FP-101664 SS1]EIW53346.1 hypothetical protein TRAVEDRAFT_66952 [Trametes versicolor FP-101664 SS1]
MHLPKQHQRPGVNGNTSGNQAVFRTSGHGFSKLNLSRASMPDDLEILIDRENNRTSITLTYQHGPNGELPISLPATESTRSRPTVPIPRNMSSVNDAAAPSNLARQADLSGSPCTRGCGERVNTGSQCGGTRPQIPLPRLSTLFPDGIPRRVGQEAAGSASASPVRPASSQAASALVSAPSPTSASPPGTIKKPGAVKAEKTLPKRKKAQKRLFPNKHSFKIRNTKKFTTFYGPTAATRALTAPPDFLRPSRAFLYVHLYDGGARGEQKQIWMYVGPRRTGFFARGEAGEDGEEEEGWRIVHPGCEHPDLPGYVLHVRNDGNPSWITAASAQKIASEKRKQERMDRRI